MYVLVQNTLKYNSDIKIHAVSVPVFICMSNVAFIIIIKLFFVIFFSVDLLQEFFSIYFILKTQFENMKNINCPAIIPKMQLHQKNYFLILVKKKFSSCNNIN